MKTLHRYGPPWLVAALILSLIAVALRDNLGFSYPSYGADTMGPWEDLQKFLHGDKHVLLDSNFVYPPPFLILMAPLGWLSKPTAVNVTQWFDIVSLTFVIVLWARAERHRFPPAAYILAGSFAAIETIVIGQFGTALSALALSLCLLLVVRKRWLLAGLALAFGLTRIGNAVPIAIALLLFIARTQPRASLYRLVAGSAIVLIPPVIAISFLYPSWPGDYVAALRAYPGGGIAHLISHSFGFGAYLSFLLIGIAACTAVLWKAVDVDRVAAALCLTVVFAPIADSYAATFGLAGLARLAGRKNPGWIALLLTIAIPWIVWFYAGNLNVAPYIATPSADLAVIVAVTAFVLRGDKNEPKRVAA